MPAKESIEETLVALVMRGLLVLMLPVLLPLAALGWLAKRVFKDDD